MKYHIYWNDRILLKDLDKEEFENLWTKLHWVYNDELNYVVVWSIIWMIAILLISVAIVIYYIMRYDHFWPND